MRHVPSVEVVWLRTVREKETYALRHPTAHAAPREVLLALGVYQPCHRGWTHEHRHPDLVTQHLALRANLAHVPEYPRSPPDPFEVLAVVGPRHAIRRRRRVERPCLLAQCPRGYFLEVIAVEDGAE